MSADSRNIAQITKEYRATLTEIDEIQKQTSAKLQAAAPLQNDKIRQRFKAIGSG